MERLTYTALEQGRYDGYLLRQAPERVLQFGEGNFLRGFAEHFIDVMNECTDFQGKVVVVPPASAGKTGRINDQEGLYQLCLRGRRNGETVDQCRIVSCISRAVDVFEEYDAFLRTAHNPNMRFILSNTTEAGIVYEPSSRMDDRPPAGFPAKLARLLWERYQTGLPGYIIFPCELIADNGGTLRDCVLRHARDWGLEAGFFRWLEEENAFCSTLVDRIVTGYSPEQAGAVAEATGLEDKLLDVAEPFAQWIIEAPEWVQGEFPAEQAGLPVRFVADHRPYRERKVRILNGGHTVLTPAALLSGHTLVRTCMADRGLRNFLDGALFQEIIPTLSLPRAECEDFALAVEERFDNPYVDHRLVDIALNSVSKWRARVLPSVEAFHRRQGALPLRLVFSFAALCALYSRGEGEGCPVRDEPAVLDFFARRQADGPEALVAAFAARVDFWGRDLTELPGFVPAAGRAMARIRADGMAAALEACGKEPLPAYCANRQRGRGPGAGGGGDPRGGGGGFRYHPGGHSPGAQARTDRHPRWGGCDQVRLSHRTGQDGDPAGPVGAHPQPGYPAGWGGRSPGSGGGWGPGPPAAPLLSGLPPGGRPGGNPQRALDRAHRGLR